MSRIGKLPVRLPSGVKVDVVDGSVQVKGPKGSLSQAIPSHISVAVSDGAVVCSRAGEDRVARANHGLTRALVANMVKGVSEGFERKLQIEGTGFRAEVKGRQLILTLGFSHPVDYSIPQGIDIAVDKLTKIVVKGIDRQQVGQVSANIRAFRTPDHYKGKGIRYEDEVLRIKEGKTA
jgi:large subunit ribosomal protein L6